MKKILSLLLMLVMALSLFSCSKNNSEKKTTSEDDISSEKNSTDTEHLSTDSTSNDNVLAAKEAIAAGNYQQAYSLLLESDSEEATALLKNFVFMPVSYKEEGGRTKTYTYDTNGNILTYEEHWKKGDWRKTVYTYDDAGRILSYTATEHDEDFCKVSYIYDESGKLLTVQHDGSFLIEWHGSSVGINRSESVWNKISYTYDEAGNTLTEEYTYPDGTFKKTSFDYDENGNMLTKEITGDAKILFRKKHIYTYNALGKIQSERVIYEDGSGNEITYTYGKNGNLIEEKEVTSYDTTITTYNDYGSILSKEIIGKNHISKDTYSYDENNNILSKEQGIGTAQKWTFLYDDNGNMIEKSVTYPHEGTAKIKYTYDEYGNWITYHCESENKLISLDWELFYFPNGVKGRAKEVLEMYKISPRTSP